METIRNEGVFKYIDTYMVEIASECITDNDRIYKKYKKDI